MIGGYVEINTKDADVIIVPDVKYDSYMDYQKAEFFIEQGYLAGLRHMDQIKAAVLAADPDFEFLPYSQPGLADSELATVIQQAERVALETKRPFGLMPEFAFSDDSALKIGARAQYGGLGWFRIGYRYGLQRIRRARTVSGLAQALLAQSRTFVRFLENKANVGVKASVPIGEQAYLSAAYQINGPYLWQLRLSNDSILMGKHFRLWSTAAVTKTEADPDAVLLGEFGANLKFYFNEEYDSLFEVTLARPYLYGGLCMAAPLASLRLIPPIKSESGPS